MFIVLLSYINLVWNFANVFQQPKTLRYIQPVMLIYIYLPNLIETSKG